MIGQYGLSQCNIVKEFVSEFLFSNILLQGLQEIFRNLPTSGCFRSRMAASRRPL